MPALITIYGPLTKVVSSTLGGTPVPSIKDWFDLAKGDSKVVTDISLTTGTARMTCPLPAVSEGLRVLLLSEGFLLSSEPVFIEITPTVYMLPVPDYVPNHSVLDPTGTIETPINWENWHDATHEHFDLTNGNKLVPGNCFGVELELDVVIKLQSDNYILHSVHSIPERVQPEDSP